MGGAGAPVGIHVAWGLRDARGGGPEMQEFSRGCTFSSSSCRAWTSCGGKVSGSDWFVELDGDSQMGFLWLEEFLGKLKSHMGTELRPAWRGRLERLQSLKSVN